MVLLFKIMCSHLEKYIDLLTYSLVATWWTLPYQTCKVLSLIHRSVLSVLPMIMMAFYLLHENTDDCQHGML